MGEFAVGALALNVAASLVANAVTSVVGQNLQDSKERGARTAQLKTKLAQSQTIRAIIGKATAAVGRSLPDDVHQDRLRLFLGSPEAETLLRQVTAVHSGYGDDVNDLSLEHSFTDALVGFVPDASAFAPQLFRALAAAVDQGIETAIANGVLIAHDARSAARFRSL